MKKEAVKWKPVDLFFFILWGLVGLSFFLAPFNTTAKEVVSFTGLFGTGYPDWFCALLPCDETNPFPFELTFALWAVQILFPIAAILLVLWGVHGKNTGKAGQQAFSLTMQFVVIIIGTGVIAALILPIAVFTELGGGPQFQDILPFFMSASLFFTLSLTSLWKALGNELKFEIQGINE